MSGDEKREHKAALRRLEDLIAALDQLADPAAREPARELVELVLDLHGLALARLVAILTAAEGGTMILARLAEDNYVRSLLLLHGLHPEPLEARVRKAADRLKPHLGVHGLRLELVETATGRARLRVHQSDGVTVTTSLLSTLRDEIEDAIVGAAPDIEAVVIEGLEAPIAGAMVEAS